ncbi:MAG: carbohydrate ABC transporter permease [Ruminiclostridium sp.]|nr:carbohydrate ABC transporter permease [Ruminiclostridium sp.]
MIKRKRNRFNFYDVFVYVFTGGFALICFYPMWYVLIASLNPNTSFIQQPPLFFPDYIPSFTYYKAIIFGGVFQKALVISAAKTLLTATGTLLLTGTMAYGVSKKYIKGMSFINFLVILTMFFSGGLVPYYFLIRDLQLLDTFWVMVIPALVSAGNFVIMRNYFSYSVPKELEDAALIDGANEIIMFFVIIIPITLPMFAAIFLFESVASWNDWYSYLIFVDNPQLQPFVWILKRLLEQPNQVFSGGGQGVQAMTEGLGYIPPASLRMTVIICAMLPIMLLYPFLQKHFAKGILIGAIKE